MQDAAGEKDTNPTMVFLNSHDVDVDVEIRQAQAKPLSLLLTYTFLISQFDISVRMRKSTGSSL